MKMIRRGKLKYYLSESRHEDAFAGEVFGWSGRNRINLSTARVLVPNLPELFFESTLGEDKPVDDWTGFELKLLRWLRRFPQHVLILHGACLDRETLLPTGVAAVYLAVGEEDGCGCEFCAKGLAGIVLDLVACLAKPA
jgi:hypothetical protein